MYLGNGTWTGYCEKSNLGSDIIAWKLWKIESFVLYLISIIISISRRRHGMAVNMQKIKLVKLYELLCKRWVKCTPSPARSFADGWMRWTFPVMSGHWEWISRSCRKTASRLWATWRIRKSLLCSRARAHSAKIKILIDVLQNVSFITEKKTAELIEKVAVLGGSHQVELLKNMVYFNTRKHTNEAILYTVNGIEDAIIRRKKIDFCLNVMAELVYVTINDRNKKR